MTGTAGQSWVIEHEPQVRLAVFAAGFVILLLLQRLWPRRGVEGGLSRQVTNLSFAVLDTALLRIAFPLLAIDFALQVQAQSLGLMQGMQGIGPILLGVLMLDAAIYWQHRLFHRIPLLWRLHRVHHADTAIDVTTGVRFHPLEIALSMGIKLGLIALLAIPPLAVLVFELLLSAGALFTHANLRIPAAFERRLRWFLVTPEMHRIHHSWHRDETDSNFSFHLSLWDRLFRSYRDRSRDDQQTMNIGLKDFRRPEEQSLGALLLNPLRREADQVTSAN